MNERERMRARLAEEAITCSDDELDAILDGRGAARAAVAGLWAVDCGDLPPAAQLTEHSAEAPHTS